MQRASGLKFDVTGVGSLLKKGLLKVPPNQREYSWEDKQVEELFTDFSDAIFKNQLGYFLGTVVIAGGSKPVPEVVDGQQRLATTTILLAAIRDYYHDKGWDKLEHSVESDFLIKVDRQNENDVSKLTLNTDDNEYFRKRVIVSPESAERKGLTNKKLNKESHRKIENAAVRAAQKVQNLVAGETDDHIRGVLNQWIDFIENRAEVVALTVQDEKDAFIMFETLNDRGLKTSQADLIKNYLFREADNRAPEAQLKWSKMISVLESTAIDDIVITYLRHLAITQYGLTREKELFKKIHDNVRGSGNAISFLDRMAEYAEAYTALTNSDHPKWNSYPSRTKDSIKVINELRVQQIRALMLAVIQKFTPNEVDLAFASFVNWTVRFLVSGGVRNWQLEAAYGEKAHLVYNGTITETKQLLAALQRQIPTDEEFQISFETAKVSQHYIARIYLRAIESHLLKQVGQSEYVPTRDIRDLNLEHILPQNPDNGSWNIDKETAEAYLNRIGNLTLVNSKANQEIGNGSFQNKRLRYKNSPLLLTKDIYDNTNEHSKWGKKEIDERQRRLAKIAIKTWPLTPAN